ncbi:putative pentatricopeptide repeat-containing protein At3g16890, mitochondrial [Durio zibethinus]|uniref:Pentatricopeptide repeat-containing protein At3g16890, mitochondrial n=1 Tax=Durio zibethinus TaxID=66656 RepID=A0A6P6A6S4_DURZI|nr:putative pentatricopeptide repeat-containing protein At3g16890, mitochondrial [Durio zibethinus]
MRRFSSATSRFTPSLKNLTKTPQNATILYRSESKNSIPASSRGNSPVNHHYISQILSRNDWFVLLNHELKAKRISLNPQFVVSLLQNQENPLYPLRFYIWVSKIDPLFAKNQSVKGVLATALYQKGPVLLSVELVKDVRNSDLSVNEDLLCLLIGSWGRLGLAKYCSEIFGQISFLGISPSTRLYNAVIDALIKSNSLDLAYLKFQQMPADNCKPDRFTYNILIHGVCRTGVMDEALRLVKQMEGLGYSRNVYTYTILIDGFCNARRVDDAFRLVETMKRSNVFPNEATVRSLIHGVFHCVAPRKAFELLIMFLEKEPMIQKLACDTLLFCLTNNHMAREAALFMKKLSGRGYMPDNSTFNLTMTFLIKEFDLDETCQILDSFIERGLKLGFNTYLALIQALYSVGQCVEGDRYFDQMSKDGLLSTVFSYNMVIDCFCKASMMDRARMTFREMCLRGIAPTLVTFNTLIGGHCKIGQVHEARKFLVMLLESGFDPDIVTFSSIIDGLCRAHMIEDAFDCFAEMFQWDVTPNDVTYNILIRSLCVIGDVARAMKLVRKMQATGISADIFSFNALIQSFCRMKKIGKAKELFVTLLTLGLDPDNYTYGALIKALCESERFDEAIQMFHSMEAKGCIPDSYTRNLVLESLVQKGYLEEARDIIKRCNQRGTKLKSIPGL